MYRIFLTALAIRKRIFTASTASLAAFCLQRCDQRAHANDERWRGVGRGRLAKDLFRQLAIVTVSRIAWAIGLSIAAGVILAGPARAQIVSNGSFEVPNVASAPNGVIENSNAALSGPGVAWKFPSVSGGDSGITLEQQASGFDAPKAPNGDQVGLIHNLGEISQSIDLKPGGYVLSFKIAQRAGGFSSGTSPSLPLPVLVAIGNQKFGPYTPLSATSYNEIEVPFQISAAGTRTLEILGQGPPLSPNFNDHTTFIDNVSIRFAPPVITHGPSDLDPTSMISLEGSNFGSTRQNIKLVFPTPSDTALSNGSKSEIDLKSIGAHDSTASTERIDAQQPTGKVNKQTVDITLVSNDSGLEFECVARGVP